MGLLVKFVGEIAEDARRDARGAPAPRRARVGRRARHIPRALQASGRRRPATSAATAGARLRAGPRERFRGAARSTKSFRRYDLALYVDGFLANEEGKYGRSARPLQQDPRVVPEEPLHAGRAHGAGRVRVHERRAQLRASRIDEYEAGPEVQGQRACTTRAVQERLDALAPRADRRSRAALSEGVQDQREDGPASVSGKRRASSTSCRTKR